MGPTFQSVISDPTERVDPDAHREKACPTYFFNGLLVLGSNRIAVNRLDDVNDLPLQVVTAKAVRNLRGVYVIRVRSIQILQAESPQ